MLNAVDAELGRIVDLLERRFPGEYVLLVTADHGQCPLPDSKGGVRLDPIQLESTVERAFGAGMARPCSTRPPRRSTSTWTPCGTRTRRPTTSPRRSST